MFERILVPLDGSSAAEGILPEVRRIFLHRDAEILLVCSVEAPSTVEGSAASIRRIEQKQADTYIWDQKIKLARQGARVRGLVVEGRAADAILATAAAAAEDASLIAMATHGRSGLARLAFGSVAEKVLRASTIPVLLARSGRRGVEPRSDPERVRKIVVPLDLSDLSLEVLPCVAEMARSFQAKVLLLNVCGSTVACEVPVVSLRTAYEKLRQEGVPAEPIMCQGDPAEGILEAARAESADLIAMTTHGRSGVSRWAFGSVAEKVLRHADVPVLIVRCGSPARSSAAGSLPSAGKGP